MVQLLALAVAARRRKYGAMRTMSSAEKRKYRGRLLLAVGCLTACVLAVYSTEAADTWGLPRRRRLLSGASSCDDVSIPDWEKNGGFLVYFVGVLYLFLGIAIVCDDFFVPSLEIISEELELSDDVAGATFMAAGSSAPELFSSFISLLSPNASNEIGVGTIVGSAVFNILVIIGATAIFAGRPLNLDWKPMTRDAVFYVMSIIGLFGVFADGTVHWWEGLIMVCCYLGYVAFMTKNANFMAAIDEYALTRSYALAIHKFREDPALAARDAERGERAVRNVVQRRRSSIFESMKKISADNGLASSPAPAEPFKPDILAEVNSDQALPPGAHRFARAIVTVQAAKKWRAHREQESSPYLSQGELRVIRTEMKDREMRLAKRFNVEQCTFVDSFSNQVMGAPEPPQEASKHDTENDNAKDAGEDSDGEGDSSPFSPPGELGEYPLWLLSLPWYLLFTITIPPCGKDGWRKWYMVSFSMSIACICGVTYYMVEWCARIGSTLDVPAVVMGTTVLAAGTSVPDALSSISVAKDGLADMAIANAVGSNVFDIFLGLGFPWMVYLPTVTGMKNEVETRDLIPSICILLGILVFYYCSVMLRGWKMDAVSGKFFCCAYVCYTCYNVIGVAWQKIYGETDCDDDYEKDN